MEKRKVQLSDGIEYAVVDEGEGPAVLLLHGFPDDSYLWRHQVPALVEAGFRVVAPDLRGCGDSSKPPEVDEYKLLRIVGDLSTLLRNLGIPRAHVVGHDWGAATAWLLAALMRAKVDHLAVLSVGHPNVFHTPTLEQRQKSWYMLLYQFEGVAEELLRRHNWALFREGIGDEGDLEHYIENFSRPGALRAALNWYRANRHPSAELEPPPRLPFVMTPTLGIWGARDGAMTEEQMVASAGFVQGVWRYERFDDSGHWIPLDEPDRLNELLVSFLGSVQAEEPVLSRSRRRF
jgi:pimeloyl-ACP methyl ester carboxylesterase